MAAVPKAMGMASRPAKSAAPRLLTPMQLIFGEDRHYQRLFPTRAFVSHRFERMYFAYRLARFVWDYAYRDGKEWKKQRHAYWTTVWLAYLSFTSGGQFFSNANVRSIRAAF